MEVDYEALKGKRKVEGKGRVSRMETRGEVAPSCGLADAQSHSLQTAQTGRPTQSSAVIPLNLPKSKFEKERVLEKYKSGSTCEEPFIFLGWFLERWFGAG